jgi:hypothetical protein
LQREEYDVNTEILALNHEMTDFSHLPLGNEPTQTIDLQSLFAPDVSQTGVFDLRDIASTSFGKLLDALPVPVLLIDKWFFVVFVNQSCEKLSMDYREIQGMRFTDLLPNPVDVNRATTLKNKTMKLLERVFADRSPQRAEAILDIGTHKIWARLNLRSVRLSSDRHIMVIIEDITSERTNQRAFQKDELKLRESVIELKDRLRRIVHELADTQQKLKAETTAHEETRRQLQDLLDEADNSQRI